MIDCEKSDCQADESNCEFCGEIVNWLFYTTECDREDCGHRNDQCDDCCQGSNYLSPDNYFDYMMSPDSYNEGDR